MATHLDPAVVEEMILAYLEGLLDAPEIAVYGFEDEPDGVPAWAKIVGLGLTPTGDRVSDDDADAYGGMLELFVVVETPESPLADRRRLMSTAAFVMRGLTHQTRTDPGTSHTVTFGRVTLDARVEAADTQGRAVLLTAPFTAVRDAGDSLINQVPQPGA